MHSEKVTVWCGLQAGGIIAPYFFQGAVNRNVTVNGERYREMISNLFLSKMQELDRSKSMTCHMPPSTRSNGLIERRVHSTFYFTFGTGQLVLQLTHGKTILKNLFIRYRPKCWKEYASIGPSGWTI